MLRTIFALRGKGGSGKSTTITYVLATLKEHATEYRIKRGRQRPGGPPEVWWSILTINGVLVGIASPGDNGWYVRKHVKPLIDAGCEVIVCATRSREGSTSVETLRELAAEADPRYGIKWIRKVSDPVDADYWNRRQSGEIAAKVLEAVGIHLEVADAELAEA